MIQVVYGLCNKYLILRSYFLWTNWIVQVMFHWCSQMVTGVAVHFLQMTAVIKRKKSDSRWFASVNVLLTYTRTNYLQNIMNKKNLPRQHRRKNSKGERPSWLDLQLTEGKISNLADWNSCRSEETRRFNPFYSLCGKTLINGNCIHEISQELSNNVLTYLFWLDNVYSTVFFNIKA